MQLYIKYSLEPSGMTACPLEIVDIPNSFIVWSYNNKNILTKIAKENIIKKFPSLMKKDIYIWSIVIIN